MTAAAATADPPRAPIVVLAAVSVLGTGWFAWSLPAAASRATRSSAALAAEGSPWGWAYEHLAPPASPGALSASLLAVTAVMVAAWVATVALTWRRSSPARVRIVVASVALASVVGVLALPTHSSDIYDYALFGRVASVHGGTPYRDLPDAYADDPLYRYSSHQYTGRPDNKLPAWTLVAAGVAAVSGDRPLVALLGFRTLLGAAVVASTALIAHLLARLRPDGAAAGAAIFGLCPVTLVYGTAKTDALMVVSMLAGVALIARGRSRSAVGALTFAVLVKAIAAPVLVLVVLLPVPGDDGGVRQRVVAVGRRTLVAAGVAAAVYLPFRDPLALVRLHLGEADHRSVAAHAVPLVLVGLAILLLTVAARGWRQVPPTDSDGARALVAGAAPALVVFAAVLTRPGLPWYLLTPLAVVALGRSAALVAVMGTLTGTSFVMGWWASIDTDAHPMPELWASRPTVYLGLAALSAVLAAGVAAATGRRASVRVRPPPAGERCPAPDPFVGSL